MFETVFDWTIIASREEITDFLRLWGLLFVIVFTLRILQRIRNWFRRARQRRIARRANRRLAKDKST